MKMRKIELFFVIFLIALVNYGVVSVSALSSGYCVDAVVKDISPTSVKIGESFTVGILIDNCGDMAANNVFFEIKDISPFISVNEPLQKNLGNMGYANSERFILYHMRALDSAESGTYLIRFTLIYEGENAVYKKDGSFSITLIGDRAKLNIASVKTNPVLPYDGDKVELTLRIENFGEGTANSIKISAKHPFQGIKDSFIGTLDPDEDGPAVFTFITDQFGEFEFPIKISYEDDFGAHEKDSNVILIVLEKKTNIMTIVFAIVVIVIVGLGILYFFKVKKSKDRIIHQLLRGNGSKEKKRK